MIQSTLQQHENVSYNLTVNNLGRFHTNKGVVLEHCLNLSFVKSMRLRITQHDVSLLLHSYPYLALYYNTLLNIYLTSIPTSSGAESTWKVGGVFQHFS